MPIRHTKFFPDGEVDSTGDPHIPLVASLHFTATTQW